MCSPRNHRVQGRNHKENDFLWRRAFFQLYSNGPTPFSRNCLMCSPLGWTGSVCQLFLIYLPSGTLVRSDWLLCWGIFTLLSCVSQTSSVDPGWPWSPQFVEDLSIGGNRWPQWLLLGGVGSWEDTSKARVAAGTVGKEWAWCFYLLN